MLRDVKLNRDSYMLGKRDMQRLILNIDYVVDCFDATAAASASLSATISASIEASLCSSPEQALTESYWILAIGDVSLSN